MSNNIPQTKPTLTIEYDNFIDDNKACQSFLYFDEINAIFKQGGRLIFIVSYCNHPVPDIKISFDNQQAFQDWLNHIRPIHR